MKVPILLTLQSQIDGLLVLHLEASIFQSCQQGDNVFNSVIERKIIRLAALPEHVLDRIGHPFQDSLDLLNLATTGICLQLFSINTIMFTQSHIGTWGFLLEYLVQI